MGFVAQWVVVQLGLLKGSQPEVLTRVDFVYITVGVNLINGRQKARTLQSIFVQIDRLHIRGRNQRHPALEKGGHHLSEDHGIANIRDEELIETQYVAACGDFIRHLKQWIGLTRMAPQGVVNASHKPVEVHSLPPLGRQRAAKHIHHHGLAATNAAPNIKTSYGAGDG